VKGAVGNYCRRPLCMPGPPLPATTPHPCSIGPRKGFAPMPRPRAYPAIYEAAQPNGVCGEREARVGDSGVCDQWSKVLTPARGSYPTCTNRGKGLTRVWPVGKFLAGPGAAPSREGHLTSGHLRDISSRQLLEATNSNRGPKENKPKGWSRGKLGAHRSPVLRTTTSSQREIERVS
jgi:hypothetical protein